MIGLFMGVEIYLYCCFVGLEGGQPAFLFQGLFSAAGLFSHLGLGSII
jgi:hypothetical protein